MEQNNQQPSANMRLLSIREVCERLGVGHWMVYEQIRRKALKTVKIGKRRLVSTRALDEFINAMER